MGSAIAEIERRLVPQLAVAKNGRAGDRRVLGVESGDRDAASARRRVARLAGKAASAPPFADPDFALL
jgi:hypothetical protein